MAGFGNQRKPKGKLGSKREGRTPSSDGAERLKLGEREQKAGTKKRIRQNFKKSLHKQRTRNAINFKTAYFKMSFTKLCKLVLVHSLFYVMN